MSITVLRRWGKARRLRSRKALAHRPMLTGTGKWHSRNTLWRYKRASRRRRLIAAESRWRNRSAT